MRLAARDLSTPLHMEGMRPDQVRLTAELHACMRNSLWAGRAGGDGHTRKMQLIKVLEANAAAFEQELAEMKEQSEVRSVSRTSFDHLVEYCVSSFRAGMHLHLSVRTGCMFFENVPLAYSCT